MDIDAMQQVLDELLPAIEAVEAKNGAILQFLNDKDIATDQDLAPYLEQAGKASNVRWLAARLRINRVLALATERIEQSPAKPEQSTADKRTETQEQSEDKSVQPAEKVDAKDQKAREAEAKGDRKDEGENATASKPEPETNSKSKPETESRPEQMVSSKPEQIKQTSPDKDTATKPRQGTAGAPENEKKDAA